MSIQYIPEKIGDLSMVIEYLPISYTILNYSGTNVCITLLLIVLINLFILKNSR